MEPRLASSRPSMSRLRVLLVCVLALFAVVAAWFALRPVPSPEAPIPVRFVDVTDESGIRFSHFNGMAGKKLLPETMGSGVAVLDYDRDGRPDLFFVNSRAWPGHAPPPGERAVQALYRNRGDGTF